MWAVTDSLMSGLKCDLQLIDSFWDLKSLKTQYVHQPQFVYSYMQRGDTIYLLPKDTTLCRHKYSVKWELTVWVAFLIH